MMGIARLRWVAVLLAVLMLAGCSATTGSGDTAAVDVPQKAGDDSGGAEVAGPEAAADVEAAADGSEEGGSVAAVDVDGDEDGGDGSPMMVRHAEISLVVEDVEQAAARARSAATAVGGYVSSEQVNPGREEAEGRSARAGWGTLVLRVPAEDLDDVMEKLSDLGELGETSSSAEDVTAEYRDVEARVKTLEAGAERLRALIEEAESLEDIAALERELTSRESELDALQARRKALADDVARSTITVDLAEEKDQLQVDDEPTTGFVAGLKQGWEAFTASVTAVLTMIGGLLPFAVLAALILVPLGWWLRRRGRKGRRTAAPSASSGASSSARSSGPASSGASSSPRPEREGPDTVEK